MSMNGLPPKTGAKPCILAMQLHECATTTFRSRHFGPTWLQSRVADSPSAHHATGASTGFSLAKAASAPGSGARKCASFSR